MNDVLDDKRDRTAFIEYFPEYVITSVWRNNGMLDYYVAAPIALTIPIR